MRILVLAIPFLLFAEDRPPVTSRIDAVTVFLDRALITRQAEVVLTAGDQTVVFADLPPEIDEQSIRIAIVGGARVDGVQSKRVFLDQRREADVRTLEAELQKLEERQRELDDRQTALAKAATYLDAVQDSPFRQPASVHDGQPVARPTVDELRAVLVFIDQQRTAQAAELRQLAAEARALVLPLVAKRRELEQVRGASTLERREIAVTLDAAAAGKVELRLSYLLPGALWVPVYDARADQARTTVELEYNALVQQATGEDWSDAQLTLSAARPALRVQTPKPTPWYLTPGQVEVQQDAVQKHFSSSLLSSWSPSQSLNAFKGNRANKQLNEAHDNLMENAAQADLVCRAVELRSTSSVFAVPGRVSVAATGKPQRVSVVRVTLPMTVVWHAVPRQSLNTYVTGRMLNATELPLLPGTVNVFVAGDLIGSAAFDFVAPRETAEFWLGVDEQVKVSRLLDEKRSSKTFFSKRKRIEAAYTISVQSFRTAPVQVAIYESLPVSQDERIKASSSDLDPKPAALERGMARWDVGLDPGKERVLSFAYTIEFPNEVVVSELQELEKRVQERK